MHYLVLEDFEPRLVLKALPQQGFPNALVVGAGRFHNKDLVAYIVQLVKKDFKHVHVET
jgi:hypothetical protein